MTLDRNACCLLLAGAAFGRLVYTYRALPDLLPVTFVLDTDRLLVRVPPHSRAARGGIGTVVAFQTDEIDPATGTGWCVTVVGMSTELADAEGMDQTTHLPAALDDGLERDDDKVVAISLDQVTGQDLMLNAFVSPFA